MYAADSSGKLSPPALSGDQDAWARRLVAHYGRDRLRWVLFCPADKMRCGLTRYRIPENAYGLELEHLPHPEGTVILTEKCEFHKGRRWAYFADGHMELLPRKVEGKHSPAAGPAKDRI